MSDKLRREHNNIDPPQAVSLAIIGIGCLFPRANDVSSYWTNIRDGVDAISEVPATHWDPGDYFDADAAAADMTYARRGGFIDAVDFDPLRYGLNPNNMEATDSTQLLGMVVARQALLDAGYATARDSQDGRQFDRDRTSVILGVTGTLGLVIPLGARLGHPIWRRALAAAGVSETLAEDVVQRIAEAYVPWQENSFPGLLGNVVAGRIANRFDLGGTNCVVDAACASSLGAIHMAAMELYSGRADMAVTGGFDTFNDIFMYMCFSKTPALSPSGNIRPFDQNGDGTMLGEGLGAIILKRLDDAKRDADHIYAVLKGIGSSSDGRGNAIYAPSAAGQIKALKDAYQQAGVRPRDIELVEAHGTGTRVGDAVEAEALSAVYRQDQATGTWCAIGSVKSMIGHTKAAAGVAGLIKIALALHHKVLPPTINVEQPLDNLQPGQAPVYVNTARRPWITRGHSRHAALSAFGFGGSNFHCVLEEAEPDKAAIEWDGKILLYAFSADTIDALQASITRIDRQLPWTGLRIAAMHSRQAFESGQHFRLLLVVTPQTSLEKLCGSVVDTLRRQRDVRAWNTPDGAFFASGAVPGKLAMLFPGQGAQYTHMLLDLACQFPQMQAVIKRATIEFAEHYPGPSLNDLIYPVAAFTDAVRQGNEAALRKTQHAQPAIGAVSYGALKVLQYFGISAEATAGHSFGELTALCAAGAIGEVDLHRLAVKRGQLMQAKAGDQGAMLAVSASAAVVHEFLEAEQLNLIIANNNAPAQVVLSGASDQIERALSRFQARDISAKKLPVSAAFHSIYVADAARPFAEFLQATTFEKGECAVYANTSGKPYPEATDKRRILLADQLVKPVEFVSEIENMYEAGVRTFVEIGPGRTLSGLVQSILGDKEHQTMALDASRGRRGGQYDLACLLAQLGALGHTLALEKWDPTCAAAGAEDAEGDKPRMTLRINGANYVRPRSQREPVTLKAKQPAEVVSPAKSTAAMAAATPPGRQTAATVPAPAPGSDALKITQESILALQKMQEQTAQVHKQYLQGQQVAQQSIQQLIQQQQQLLSGRPADLTMGPPAPRVDAAAAPVASPDAPPDKVETVAPAVQLAGPLAAKPAAAKTVVDAVSEKSRYETILLEVVADKTGYPVDMLSMDMSLDTDLGIDSIKRVEILSALQEKLPGVAKIQPEDLGTFQVLRHIVEFLASAAPAVAPPGEETSVADTGLQDALLEVVAEKTGYPVEMLNLEMNLDTDLGIDSIKRVEILSAFQERMPAAPTVNPEDLAQLQTLQQIVSFMQGQTQAVPAEPAVSPADDVVAPVDKLQTVLLEVVAEKTGYPVEMLNLEMNLDTDLGIDSIKRVEILSAFQEQMPDAPAVAPEHLTTLQTLQQIVDHMAASTATAGTAEVHETGAAAPAENRLYRSVVEVLPLDAGHRPPIELGDDSLLLITDDGSDLPQKLCVALARRNLRGEVITVDGPIDPAAAGLIIPAPVDADSAYVFSAFQLLQRAAATLRKAGKDTGAILVSVTRLGGAFGIEEMASVDPAGGGLAGLVKTAAGEWPEVHCKALDIATGRSSAKLAATLVEEMFTQGPLEVGVRDTGRCQLSLHTTVVDDKALHDNPFTAGDTLVISGGARGITAEVAVAMARDYKVDLLLLGRSPLPEPEADWLRELQQDAAIKQAIIEHNSAAPPALAEVETRFKQVLANREILHNIQRMRACGVQVTYQSVDVRERTAVAEAIDGIRAAQCRIAGIIHGAGVLADRLIEDKTEEQFQQVYATKVAGCQALLDACVQDELKVMIMFSSSTARFGRKGQVDYAIANEVLNKIAQQQQQQRPGCRVLSVNWGPWDGGMVTAPLKKLFAGEGVGVIPLQAGADYLAAEIAAAGPVEVVVMGSVPDKVTGGSAPADEGDRSLQVASEQRVSVAACPILKSHVMNGKAVVPAALMAEWLAQGAMHNLPGLAFIGFNNFQVLKGIVLEAEEEMVLQIRVGKSLMQAGEDLVDAELGSGSSLHARAQVVLGSCYPQVTPGAQAAIQGEGVFADREYYANGQLFHGPALQSITRITACSASGIAGEVSAAPAPSSWMAQPVRSSWLADPMIIDAAFQMMILWSFQHCGKASLPTKIAHYRQFQGRFPGDGARLLIQIDKAGEHAATANMEIFDRQDKLLARIEGYECVIDGSLHTAFSRNTLELATRV